MSLHTHILKINERVIVMEIAEVNDDIKCTLRDDSVPGGWQAHAIPYEYDIIFSWFHAIIDGYSKTKCLHVFDPQYVLTS